MEEENTRNRETIEPGLDSGPSFLSQLIGLVLVVILVVGVWALVTDTLPGGAPGTTVSETHKDTTLDTDRDHATPKTEQKDSQEAAPVAPAPAAPEETGATTERTITNPPGT